MTTDDPFLKRPPNPAPGMLSADATPLPSAPPPIGGAPAGWTPEKPTTLAWLTISATGLAALTTVVSALGAPEAVERLKIEMPGALAGEPMATSASAGETLLSLLWLIGWVASFILLAIWMGIIRENWRKRGIRAGGPPAVEWWGWFVPLAQYVLPFLGMKAIARRTVSIAALLGWWLLFCGSWVAINVMALALISSISIDTQSGETTFTNPDALDTIIPAANAMAILLVLSWGFLVYIIHRVTDRHVTAS